MQHFGKDKIQLGMATILKDMMDGEIKAFSEEELQEVFTRLMDIGKGNLVRDGQITPIAAILTTTQKVEIVALVWDTPEAKEEAFLSVAKLAKAGKELGLVAGVVTILDTYCKSLASEEELKDYKQGDLSKCPDAIEMLVGTLTRVGHKPLMVCQPYTRTKEEGKPDVIEFGDPHIIDGDAEGAQVTMNILPDWTDDSLWHRKASTAVH